MPYSPRSSYAFKSLATPPHTPYSLPLTEPIDMNISPKQPWLTRDIEAQNRARTGLWELFGVAEQLFTHWECMTEWDTRLSFGPLHRAPGASDLRVKFSAQIPSFANHAPYPVLKLWPTWAYAHVNPTEYSTAYFTRKWGHPEPHEVGAESITFVRINWATVDIGFLPDLFRSFKSLRYLRRLEFESCILPAESLRQLQRVISWHPPERGPITDINFRDCALAIENVRFLTLPSPTNWNILQSLTLYSPSPSPSPLEGQDRFLQGLSLLPLDHRPRLRSLHYSVKDAHDLWNALGSQLSSFSLLEELTIWIREAVLTVPDQCEYHA
ncbi:hypothetical protein NUW54_g5826 [Trametes sanguinea]|uniref:Uncharacterized protein n=1 Tax=Trametes sanguinea TaxID=158606 RepID=A0ACC1PUI7_9APHY|nr:hypothetical protein NUW54_g5826 [Trametes sanguinea]